MNRAGIIALTILFAATLAAPVDAGTARIESRGVNCAVSGTDLRARYVGDDLVLSRGRTRIAMIGPDYTLTVRGEPVALTPEQHFDVALYRSTHDVLVAEAKELGTAGARFGLHAAASVVRALFAGDVEEVEARIEQEAGVIEARAAEVCALAETLEERHRALVAAIPEFAQALQ